MVTAAGALIHLKQREQQFLIQSIALESAASAIVITDREGNIVWVNPAFTRLTGYTAAEVIGRNTNILKSGRHDRAFYRALWESVLAGQVWRGEIINKRKDGTFFTEELTVAPVKNNQEGITNFVAIAQDITQRKQLEAALQQRERNFHDVVAHAPYGILVIDATGRCLFANQEVATLAGYSIEELLQLNSDIMIPPEDLPRIRALRQQRFRGELAPAHYEQKVVRKDGTTIVVELTVSMTTWNDQPAGLVMVQDLTERQKMIADLQQRQAELSLLNRVITATTDADDPQSILTIACRELAHYFDVPQAAAALLNDDQTRETVIAECCAADRPCAVGTVLPVVGSSATQYVIDHRQPLAVADVPSDPRMAPIRDMLRWRSTVSMLLLPLTTRDKVIGTISLESLQKRVFSSTEIRLAANIAGAVAQAVARAQLFEKEQQRRAELEELRKISLQIIANLETEELLKVILASAMQLTIADDVHVFLYDGQQLHFGAAMNSKGYMSIPISEPQPGGLTYTVARTGRRFVVPDVNVHPLFEGYRWGGAIAGIPLTTGGARHWRYECRLQPGAPPFLGRRTAHFDAVDRESCHRYRQRASI